MLVGDGSHPLDRQFRAGSPFGIPLYFHIILLFFMGFWVLTSLIPFRPWRMLWPVILMGSVYLHELGHALSSGYFGARPKRIVLHLFGGVAEVPHGLSRKQELWVIAWGPLVSLALAVLGWVTMLVFKSIHAGPYLAGYFIFQINLILFIFNILPIFPLDGGQFFRGWLTLRKGQTEGIRRSLPLSMATLVVMGLVSLIFNWIGIFGLIIAIALFMVNHQEYQRWQHLYSRGFWGYLWPFGGSPKGKSSSSRGGGDRWPGEKTEAEAIKGGGFGDRIFVWLNRKKAEALMRKADEVGVFNLDPKERALLERYLDAKLALKERKQDLN